MVKSPKEYVFNSSPIKSIVNQFISNGHYTGTCPSTVFSFSLEYNNNIIGGCTFSTPSRQNITVPNCSVIIELSRLYIIDDTPKNTESYFIGKCLNWLKLNSKYEAVVSFSDTTQGHQGGIYKACNFTLLGQTRTNYHYEMLDGKRIHKRQVWSRAKKNKIKEIEQALQDNLKKVTELPKNKFVFYLQKNKKVNYIYGLFDPRNDELRYIGKTEQGYYRFKEHLNPRSLRKGTHKDNWIKELLNLGLSPLFYVLETHNDPKDLFDAEKFWISYYKGLGCKLTNLTSGGEGTTGYKHKEETKEFLSRQKKGKNKGLPLPYGMKQPKEHVIINNKEYRECSKCLEFKPLNLFLKIKDRWGSYCKECTNKYQTEWKKLNPTPLLSETDYNSSRLPGAKAGGETSKCPERRLQASLQRSKAILGTHVLTGETIRFESALKAKEAGFQNSNIGQAIKFNKPYRSYHWSFV